MKTTNLDPKDFELSDEQMKEHAAQQADDNRKPVSGEKSGFQFIRVPLNVCRKLAKRDAVWGMFCALYETWFTAGRHEEHPNPFPLNHCDAAKWGLTRWRKSRALRVLAEVRLIKINRRNSKSPSITLTWAPRFVPRGVAKTHRGVAKTHRDCTEMQRSTSENRLLSSSSLTSLNKYVPN
jgi:hypothetical protein